MKKAIIIIHGYCGHVSDVEPLATRLKQLDFDVYTPCLKGHTGKRRDLKQVSYTDWIKDVEDVYLMIQEQYSEIIIIGFSMGGLLALQIANKYDVKGVITLNTPIYMWSLKNIFRYILLDIKNKQLDHIKKYMQFIYRFSLSSTKHFLLLLKETKRILKNINCDIYLNQAIEDETVRYQSVNYLYDHIGSKNKQKKLYHRSNHLILESEIAEEVMNDLLDYIKSGK